MAKAMLTKEEILMKKFNPEKHGYSPVEVDEFLDRIIEDYAFYEKTISDLNEINEKNKQDIDSLNKAINKLKVDFSLFKNKFKHIKEDDIIDNKASFELLKKVNILEEFISSKGYDPKKIK